MLDLSKIQFPIFPLPRFSNVVKDGSTLYYPSASQTHSRLVVDDKDVEGEDLASRRLRMKLDPFKRWKLFRLDKPIFHYVDLLRNDDKTVAFIDSSGRVFKYIKKEYYPVRYHAIVKYYELKGGGYAIKVLNIPCLFKVNKLPGIDIKYAGILFINKSLVLYDLSSDYIESYVRKV